MSEVEKKDQTEMREKIMQLEGVLKNAGSAQVHIEPRHYFAPGIYMREIFIPKGVVLTGKIHKTEHLNVLSLGEVSVWNGEGTHRIKASSVIHSMPGTKRAIYAHEDSVWINVHHNPENERDLDKIEEFLIAKSFEDVLEFTKRKEIEGGN